MIDPQRLLNERGGGPGAELRQYQRGTRPAELPGANAAAWRRLSERLDRRPPTRAVLGALAAGVAGLFLIVGVARHQPAPPRADGGVGGISGTGGARGASGTTAG
jgi:hypothetical protein